MLTFEWVFSSRPSYCVYTKSETSAYAVNYLYYYNSHVKYIVFLSIYYIYIKYRICLQIRPKPQYIIGYCIAIALELSRPLLGQ
jgi:hypothetical protein